MFIRKGTNGHASLNFRVGAAVAQIKPRQDKEPDHKNHTVGIVIGCVFAGCCLIGFLVIGFLRWRRLRKPKYALSAREDTEQNVSGTPVATTQTTTARAQTSTVDRNTSIRSVMTLPPYRPKASDNEHVLGREGERGGIDVVLELPTAEDEEAMREEEMDTLFQIRQARRRQAVEREQRRQARQEARERNDRAALHAIRQQASLATTNNTSEIETLRSELERARETRQRAVSKVNYADVGVARHDGTRIRANSSESERVGLLSDAASISASNRSSGQQQGLPPTTQTQPHRREQSASSVLSIDTSHSDGLPTPHGPPSARSRTSSIGQHTRAGSSPELIDAADADLGGSYMPSHSPPSYDEVSLNELSPMHSRSASPYAEPPPDYTPSATAGPSETRNRRLSAHVADLAAESSAAVAEAATEVETESSVSRSGSGSSNSSRLSRLSRTSHVSRRASRNSNVPRLPSLRLPQLPQIVVEPSSAVPRDEDER